MMTLNADNAILRQPIPIRNGLVSYLARRLVGASNAPRQAPNVRAVSGVGAAQ